MPVSEDNQTAKRALREQLLAERAALPETAARSASEAVCAHIARLPELRRARVVALYRGVRGEIHPSPLHRLVVQSGGRAVFPSFRRATTELTFHVVEQLADLVPGPLDIPCPAAGAPLVPLSEIDVFVVPGVAFDPSGHRLGQGRGYYDRALAAAPVALRIGVAHPFQIVQHVPHEAHDQRVDCIVTPDGPRPTQARDRGMALEVM